MTEYIHNLSGTWKNKVDAYIALTEFGKRKFIECGLPGEKVFVKPNFLADPPEPSFHIMAMLSFWDVFRDIAGKLFQGDQWQAIFRMAPIHHHFELKGWPEPKVIVRFWIIAIILGLLSLSALKLR